MTESTQKQGGLGFGTRSAAGRRHGLSEWRSVGTDRRVRQYPELKIELVNDYGLSNIVADRYDIGVRLGDQVAKDMIAVRIAPDMTMAIVSSPSYL